jgi:hypothetical protein
LERYQVTANTWGITPLWIQNYWKLSSSGNNICKDWATSFNVVPYISKGDLPEDIQALWNGSIMHCNSELTYIGCYQDSFVSKLFSFYPVISTSLMTTNICATACALEGFEYAGLENGFQCICGSTEELTKATKISDSKCSSQCTGSSQENCGGDWTLSIYKTSVQIIKELSANYNVAEIKQICNNWLLNYSIVPFVSYGSLSTNNTAYSSWFALKCDLQVGPYNPQQCVQAQTSYNIAPYISMGTAPSYVQSIWSVSDCNATICQLFDDLYGQVVVNSYNPMAEVQSLESFQNAYKLMRCGSISNIKKYDTSDILKLCQSWAQVYSVIPFVSNGTLASNVTAFGLWHNPLFDCDFKININYSPTQCRNLMSAYTFIPGVFWGNVPSYIQTIWSVSNCAEYICSDWQKRYKVIPNFPMGVLPSNLVPSWNALSW